jgi:hypothetical protein
MKAALKHHGLSLAFGVLLLGSLAGQAFTGVAHVNEEATAAALPTYSLSEYLTSSHFVVDVAENWQSEYLQFLLFILLTVWLVEQGSPESKKPGQEGRESDKDQKVGRYAEKDSPQWAKTRGWRLSLLSHSLGLTMLLIFALSWGAQFVAGRVSYNSEQLRDLQDPLSWGDYLGAPDFWNRTLQNWQSEFLAVASMVVLSIYLRERGSPESKPVGEPHQSTGVGG